VANGDRSTRELRATLVAAHAAAVDAVGGRQSVARYLATLSADEHPTQAVAIGKAAADMMAGAFDALGATLRDALVLTKHGHAQGLAEHAASATVLESSHPVPDASCLRSGAALWEFVTGTPADARVLVMVSGGASALVEHLAHGLDAQFLARVNAWLLANALAIGPMNRVRKRISRIKGGRLALALGGRSALCLMISDVPGDDPRVIGSGPLAPHVAADIDVSDLDLPDWLARVTAKPPPLGTSTSRIWICPTGWPG
jgi:hydroxypyruvate reductase